ncbi:uncharacterized protein ARMOST_12327 [Armillaria ostoyae]|uniref:Uncharacterized protein n=1 Tax=Armillaria ostoyae TaxID=47428 RepID=A0A284RJN5_ARMOS|nr:uncharacterized protein ARMOST_12327 [Armillaria ostoyae]
MKQPLPKVVDNPFAYVQHDNEMDEDWFDGWGIERGHVRGFNVGSAEGHRRRGELVVEAADGIAHTFKIRITHRFPIPEDTYTLLGGDPYWSCQWAIGRRLPDQRFEKVSVIAMDNLVEARRLDHLSLAARSCNVLI